MVVRKRRKKNKMRGNRMHGGGNTKNRRGSGNRGGFGKAGSHKHKFSKYYVDFGVKRTLKAKARPAAINLEDIGAQLQKWIASGKAKSEGGMILIDGKVLGFGKILGQGVVKEKLRIVNAKASKEAFRKITAAGGNAEAVEGAEAAAAEDEEFEVEEAEGEVEGSEGPEESEAKE